MLPQLLNATPSTGLWGNMRHYPVYTGQQLLIESCHNKY